MKLTKNKIRKLIIEALLKEYKRTGEEFTITPPKLDIPGLMSGNQDPPDDDDDEREGPENKCQSFQEIHEAVSYMYGTLVEWFMNKNITDYSHLDIYDVTDIPLELAIKDHGIYIAKELLKKCGRYNTHILKFISNPFILLSEDPEYAYNQNFSVSGIEKDELIHTIWVLHSSIKRITK